jgi:hypothetical protein
LLRGIINDGKGLTPIQRYERRTMAERYYRVDIQFRNGASESFDAQAFDIDVSNIGVGTEAEQQADHLLRFSYTGRSGEEVPIYLVPAQVAGIVMEERYSA